MAKIFLLLVLTLFIFTKGSCAHQADDGKCWVVNNYGDILLTNYYNRW